MLEHIFNAICKKISEWNLKTWSNKVEQPGDKQHGVNKVEKPGNWIC